VPEAVQKDWIEIDVTETDGLKKPAVEVEQTLQEDTPTEKPVKKVVASDEDPELDGVQTEGAQRRIKKLIAQRKARDGELAAERERTRELEARLSRLEKVAVESAEADATAYSSTLEANVKLNQERYTEAFKAGDADAAAEAMQKLVDAKMELSQLKSGMAARKVKKSVDEDEDRQGGTEGRASTPQQRQAKPNVNPKTQQFIEEHADWWGKDEVMTAATAAIARKLENEGYSPDDDEYYEETKARLAEAFPTRFGKSTEGRKKNVQTLGGASRGSAPNRVRLSASEQDMARRLGLTNEQYGRGKLGLAETGYTVIDV